MKNASLFILFLILSVVLPAQDNCYCAADKSSEAAQPKTIFNYKNGKKIKVCGEYQFNEQLKAVLWSYIFLVECDSSYYFDFTPHNEEMLRKALLDSTNSYPLKPTREQQPLIVFTNDTAYLKMMMPIAAFDEDSSQHYDSYSLDCIFYSGYNALNVSKLNPKLRKMDAMLFEKAKKAFELADKSRAEKAYFQELFFHAMVSGFAEAESMFLILNKSLLNYALSNLSSSDVLTDEALYFKKVQFIFKIGA